MAVNKVKLEERKSVVREKDLQNLTTLCNLAKQVMNQYSEDIDTLQILRIAFVTDLITPDNTKVSEIVDKDVMDAFNEYTEEVRGKLYERGII